MHKIDIPDWAIARGRIANHFPRIEPAKTALVVIDLQNAFMSEGQPWANSHARDIVPNVNRLAQALRAAGGQVIWTRAAFIDAPPLSPPAWQMTGQLDFACLTPGSFGHAIHADMDVRPADQVIDKYKYSAFIHNSSDIDARLRAAGIDTIIISGTVTNGCCESTARDGHMLGYKVLFVSDGTAAFTDAEHNAALLSITAIFADVRPTDEMISLIESSAGRQGIAA